MKITDIKTYVLVADNADVSLTSSAQDTVLVIVETDEGITGYGETDTNPWVVKALIQSPGTHTMDQSMKDILIGMNPLNISECWKSLYVGTAMTGRRGAGVNAIGAIDMALWDIKGKYEEKPIYELLGGNVHDTITPYASLQPLGSSFEEYRDSLVEWAEKAKKLGFKAVKSEVTMNGPYSHNGMNEDDDKHTKVFEAVRKAEFNIYFLETPVWTDNLDDYARMHEEAPMKIAAGEWLSTAHEFKDLIERGKVDVAQPDIGRVGGLTEAKKVSDIVDANNRIIVPHCWKTSISISATAHFAFNTPSCKFIEYLPPQLCHETLRRELAIEGFDFKDGLIQLPTKSGLGIDLNQDAVKKYRVD